MRNPAAAGGDGVHDPAGVHGPADGDMILLLEAIHDRFLQLLAASPESPDHVRIQAGAVCVEASWRRSADGMHGTAGAMPAAVVPPAQDVASSNPEPKPEANVGRVCAPSVGVFYRAPKPGAEPFVRLGDEISPGQQVGIVEAMKLMIPVTSDIAGTVADILKDDGEPVEYGEPLFAVTLPG
jgi:acetyl-CoA carboxylase biotin carboxyl carrier protein